VVAIEPEDVDTWLFGTVQEAAAVVRLTPESVFDARPVAPGP
jgi:putative SOS response-associated peptidase YedK